MKYKVLVSENSRAFFNSLEEKTQKRIKTALNKLNENPFKKRSGADIKKLEGSFDPILFRLRVGEYRLVYSVIEKEVKITSIIHRSKGYKWLE
jgi:mRNA interferase RelE/StbE